MHQQHAIPITPVKRFIHQGVASLALALIMMASVQTLVMATHSNPEDSTVVYNGKCPGDKDDDCRD